MNYFPGFVAIPPPCPHASAQQEFHHPEANSCCCGSSPALWGCNTQLPNFPPNPPIVISGHNPISFPRHEEEQLQRSVSWRPCLLILGQDCAAKCQLLNALLGQGLLPTPGPGPGGRCRRRRVRFTHGARTRLSLALPGQFELVQALVAHSGHWDTIPEQDLQVPGDAEDPAQRVAELEVVLPCALLKVRVALCLCLLCWAGTVGGTGRWC